MRLDVIPNFINQDEINQLNAWVEKGVENKWLDLGKSTNGATNQRLTTRMYGHRFNYPPVAHSIFQRIREQLNFLNTEIIKNHGKDGIVVSYTKVGGDVYKHRDPSDGALSALRCNIITQGAEEGGKLFVDGNEINVNVGDLHCYLASDYDHYVTKIEGTKPRILWMFGFAIEKQMWEKDGLS